MPKYPTAIEKLYKLTRDEYRRMFWLIIALTTIQTAINVVLLRAVFGG